MKFLEPNIVVVDDKIDEIQGIIKHFNDLGLGCKYFNSDLIEGDNHPEKEYSDVNLFFLDLFYSDNPFDAELCANWVQAVIPEKSFYILILWTKDVAKATEVLEQLKKVNRNPFICLIESKIDYTIQSDEKYDFTKLFENINSELDKVSGLSEIQLWKKNIKFSYNKIIGNLTKTTDSKAFNNKLKKIIISHGGTAIKSEVDSKRKRSILFDALDSVLVSNRSDFQEEISEINNQNLYNLNEIVEPIIDKELNSWFHFKIDKKDLKGKILPGLIAYNNHSLFRKLYSIQDDPKLEKILLKQKEENVIIQDVVLVLSRPCDIAQNKFGKNIKLLSGVILKKAFRNQKGKIHFNETLPDSVKIYEHLYFNDEENDITLMFDFRYSFSVPEKIFNEKFQNLKIFNKELLSEMQVEYSSYSSRLGITQII
ncbi:hypothetical protein [Flavobacterium eburneipallidum]|uniref:hypothetical protein n=1 Tax=Flavobacterium eburneipallidum TaxID=3003263 RepID=UPI002482C291|nr:hypothetical protein [Flavobacterium eburneipallidum]